MKVLIIEDEQIAADYLQKLLQEIDSSIEVLAVIPSASKAISWFKNNLAPDIVFLDIYLSDNISFSIFDSVVVKAPIIFTTAYDHYALKAFKLNSIDYLLKPFDKSELKNALDKYHDTKVVSKEVLDKLLHEMKNQDTFQKRFMVTSGSKIRSIGIDDIAYFQSEGRYVKVILNDESTHLIDYTLDKLETMLDPEYFFRINRQFIIKIQAIKQMTAYTKGRIKIETTPASTEELIVSIDRSADFKNWLSK
ncbi:MAG: LytTR family DNA-binding domain-containing protein [Bacteroidota bacterium]